MTSTIEVEGGERGRGKSEKGEIVGGRKVNELYFTNKDLELDFNLRGRGDGREEGISEKEGKVRMGEERLMTSISLIKIWR